MSIWQYNAWCDAHRGRQRDLLAISLQGAYYTAYYTNEGRRAKPLSVILDSILKEDRVKEKPIDVKKVEGLFKDFEELQIYGRTKVDNN